MNEQKKIKPIHILIIVIIIVVVLLIPYYLFSYSTKEGITAIEGKEQADEIAHNWNENAKLVYVGCGSEISKDGYFSDITYKYWDGTNSTNNSLKIKIFSDGKSTTRMTDHYNDEYPIENWTIDSPSAISIAKSNSQIKKFLSKYDDAEFDGCYLFGDIENGSNAFWEIYWSSQGFLDNPHNARIEIDAINGNILDVETQMG